MIMKRDTIISNKHENLEWFEGDLDWCHDPKFH